MTNNTLTRNKANRTQYLASLRSKVQEMSSPKGGSNNNNRTDDDRFWKPEVDKTGTGSAVIRFLPAKIEESFPFVQLWSHGFKGPGGKWFIENCPTSVNEDCPVCKANTELWATGNDLKKKLASARKRKLNYISNILVISDPKHPENNGKVFLYKYGKKIFAKITDMINPPEAFADMASVDPFDMEEGTNFKLRITRQDNYPNYDKSSFDNQTPIGNEDFIASIESQLHSLSNLLEPSNFKSFADLQKRFNQVNGGATESVSSGESDQQQNADSSDQATTTEEVAKPKLGRTATKATTKVVAPKQQTSSLVDDDEDYFAKLAEQSSE